MANEPTATRLNAKDAADFLGVAAATLARWRGVGTGPVFMRLGPRRIAYDTRDLNTFLEQSRTRTSNRLANEEQ